MEITRGDIFIADLNPVQGSEQGGIRPVLVIQNDRGNRFSPTVICAAMTSRVGKSDLPTHAWVSARDSGLKCDSLVLCDAAVRAGHRMTGKGTKLSMRGGKRSAA